MNNEEYYKYLKDENYKSLLSAEMQLDSARQRAMKNTQTQMAAQGLASAGYGSTNQMGIENQYLQGLQNAQNQYQQQQTQINFAEQEAKENQYNSLTQMMGSAQSRDELGNLLQAQGYGRYENGNFAWNKDKLDELGEDNAINLQSLYGMYGSQLDSVAELAYAQEWDALMSSFSQAEFGSEELMNKWIDAYIDTSKMTEEQRKKWDLILEQKSKLVKEAEDYNKANTITNSLYDGKITTNFSSNTKESGQAFEITVGDYTYDVGYEGSKPSNQAGTANHQMGDIWTIQEGDNFRLVIKGSDGDAHYINVNDLNYEDRPDFWSDMFKALGYNVEATTSKDQGWLLGTTYGIKIDGVWYKIEGNKLSKANTNWSLVFENEIK